MENKPTSPSSGTGLRRHLDRRRVLGGALGAGVIAAAAIPAVRWLSSPAAAEPLRVGGLAVTCNLTLPVACAASAAANEAGKSGGSQLADRKSTRLNSSHRL